LDLSSFSPSLDEILQFITNHPEDKDSLSDRSSIHANFENYFLGDLSWEKHGYSSFSVSNRNLLRGLWVEYLSHMAQQKNNINKQVISIDGTENGRDIVEILDSPCPKTAESSSSLHLATEKSRIVNWLETWKSKRLNNNHALANVSQESKRNQHKRKFQHNLDEDEEFSIADTISEIDSEEEEDQNGEKRGHSSSTDDQELCNVYFLVGKTGTGKTSLVYESAKTVGASVIEINTTQTRNSATLKRLISEAAQSYQLTAMRGEVNDVDLTQDRTEAKSGGFSLILIDEVDIVFEEEDAGFHSSIAKLANASRIPIILTAERLPDALKNIRFNYCDLKRPAVIPATNILKSVCNLSNNRTNQPLEELVLVSQGDLRASQSMLNLYPVKPEAMTGSRHLEAPSFESWLTTKTFDFTLFDALRAKKFSRESSESKQTEYLFLPEVHSVFPPIVAAENNSEITIYGQNFLQNKAGDNNSSVLELAEVNVYIGNELQSNLSFISDTEIKIHLQPVGRMNPGFHSVRVEVVVHKNCSFSSRTEGWIIISDDVSVLELSKVLNFKSRTFGGLKTVEMKQQFFAVVSNPKKSTKKRKKTTTRGLRKLANRESTEENKPLSAEEGEDDEMFVDDGELDTSNERLDESYESKDNNNDNQDGSFQEENEFSSNEGESQVKRRRVVDDNDEGDEQPQQEQDQQEANEFNDQEKSESVQTAIDLPVPENKREEANDGNSIQSANELQNLLQSALNDRKEFILKLDDSTQSKKDMHVMELQYNPETDSSLLQELENYTKVLDHFSSSDLISAEIANLEQFDDSFDFEQQEIPISLTMRKESLENVNSSYRKTLSDHATEQGMVYKSSNSEVCPAMSYLQLSYQKEYLAENLSYELEVLHEMPSSSVSLSSKTTFYGEFLPFLQMITKESLVYEEKETEFQKLLLESERKSSRGRRLQCNNEKVTPSSALETKPRYQYFKEISQLEEHSLEKILQLYGNLKY
jgi:hypothetical protein